MKPKNILFITTDQQQFDAIGNSGTYYTPNLDKLSEMGVTFTKHIVTSAQCAPSRATWMTGRYPHQVGVNIIGHMLDPQDENIAYSFNDAGYETVYFGKWHLGGRPSDYGFKVTDYRTDGVDLSGANESHQYFSNKDAHTTAQTINYLDEYSGKDPFFMHVSWYMPHPNQPETGPFEDVSAFDDRFKKSDMPVPNSYYKDDLSTKPAHQQIRAQSGESKLTEELIREDARKYRKLVSLMDRNLGKILEKLEEKMLLDHTMILFTSDHGDMQGAHRLRLKGVLPYKELYHVPLIMYLPWISSKRKVIGDLTSSASLSGTMLDAAGVPLPESFYPSLLPLLDEETENPEAHVFIEHYKAYWGQHPLRGIQTENYKYVYYYEDNIEEMYDLQNDPDELKNICNDTQYKSIKQKLKDKVDDWWAKTGALSKEPIVDPESTWGKAKI
ncbi:sulfatase-like hydrolase/transferase [Metabacillus niabensis]|uniref:sulfatase-like hydrolase/transferase n=1 Tax=Metabacillus niabensis TaxID=324854 RepID=UPI001CFC46A1|nr:sulfatase-like hydrolase/transferase [Metabacillus niabensis]